MRFVRAFVISLFLLLILSPSTAMAAEFEAYDVLSLKNAIKAAGAVSEPESTISVSSTIEINESVSLTGGKKQITIKRAEGFLLDIFSVKKGARLTLASISVDGNGDKVANATGALIYNEGKLTMKPGASLTSNRRVKGKSGNANGGAVVNLGTFDMRGGIIRDNHAQTGGGGVFNFGGSVSMSGDAAISNNKAHLGGGVANADGGQFTMSGRASIEWNTAFQGGGLINSGANARAKLLGDALISSNTADFGSGIMNTAELALSGRVKIGKNAGDNGLYIGLSQGADGAKPAKVTSGLKKGARVNLEGGVDYDGDGLIPILQKTGRAEWAHFYLTGDNYTLEYQERGPLSLRQYALDIDPLENGDMAITLKAPLESFLSITLFGTLRLDRDYALASAGEGTRLTLKAKYLSALAPGEYFLRLECEGGKAETVFRHEKA